MRYLLVALLFCTSVAQAQTTRYFDGSIGSFPIVMELNTSNEGTVGAYFYKSQKKNINFEKVKSAKGLTLKTRDERGEVVAREEETFDLSQATDGSLTGNWTSPKGRKLPVSLHPFDPKKMAHPYAKYKGVRELLKDEPLDYIRTASIQLTKDSIVKKGTLTLQYVSADHSPYYIPTIVSGVSADVADRINDILLSRLIVGAARTYTCDIDFHIESVYAHNNILSIDFMESWYCPGTAHPDDAEYGVTLNTQTGKELILENLLHFPGVPAAPPESADSWISYRSEKYAPKLMTLLKLLFPKQMKEDSNAECDYSSQDVWDFCNWYLSPAGLHLLPSFPHVAGVCKDESWSIIPYKTLKKYTDPTAKLELPAQ